MREKATLPSHIIPVPAVNAAILWPDRTKILLTRRSQKIREPGKWCLPGGHLEYGEQWLASAIREVQEEVGITLVSPKLCGLYSDPELTVTQEEVIGMKAHAQFVVAVFWSTHFEGEIRPNDEVDSYDWFTPGNLPSPMVKSHPVRVQDAFQFQGRVFVR